MLKKRPLFTGAVFCTLLIWLFTGPLGMDPFPSRAKPQSAGTLTGEVLRAEEKGERIFLYLVNAHFADADFRRVLLILEKNEYEKTEPACGNLIEADVVCCGFSKARNEGNFDEADYYHSLGVEEKFEFRKELKITDPKVRVLRNFLEELRQKIASSIRSVADEETAGVFEAVVTGGRSGLDKETKELYQKNGIAHILAISGLHISLLGMVIFSLLRKILPFSAAAVISGLIMICFCLMSGESASAVRATLMYLLRLLSQKFGKTFDSLTALGAAAVFLLVQNPFYLYHTGFQLSFGAIFGIDLLVPAFSGILSGGKKKEEKGRFPDVLKKIKPAFLASLSVTLFTLPVILNMYYQVPVFSVFLNLLVVPLMGLVLEGGAAGALAGILSLFLGRMMIGLSVYLLDLIRVLCGILDRIPFSVVITGHMSGLRVLLYYGTLAVFLLLSLYAERRGRKGQFPKRAAFVLLVFLLLQVFVKIPASCLSVTFFDVDQGDGILIESPSGLNYMIDGGSSSVSSLYQYRLESALKYKGTAKLDYIIITHPDRDHISGILSLLEEAGAGTVRAGSLLIPFVPDNENYEEIIRKAKEAGVPVSPLHAGMVLKDGAITLRCLHPDEDFRSEDSNAYSAVMELTFGAFRGLFTGDLGEEGERMLLAKKLVAPCQLLKVAHHGSRFSSTKEFLDAVHPKTAVISAGIANLYGHPHPDVLERLRKEGSRIYVTSEHGAVSVSAFPDGETDVRTVAGTG